MDKSLQELIAHGKSLGYADKELQEFVKEQQDFLRDKRAAARQSEKDELQFKLHMQEMANAHELKAGVLRYKRLQLPKICRGTEIVRMNSNNPRSPLETHYR